MPDTQLDPKRMRARFERDLPADAEWQIDEIEVNLAGDEVDLETLSGAVVNALRNEVES